MAKINVLDTSVFLSAGRAALFSFEGEDVVIPLVVVRELESKRNDPELGLAARSVLRALDELRSEGDLKTGVEIEGGGTVRIEVNHVGDAPEILRNHPGNDSRIITVAHALSKEHNGSVTLYSKDLPLKVVASLVDVKTADFVPAMVSGDFIDATENIVVSGDVIDAVHKNGRVILDEKVPVNTGVVLRDEADPKHSALVISKLGWEFSKVEDHKIGTITGRSAEQTLALNYLMDESIKIVSLGGRAGTGKTTLALAAGLDQVKRGLYKKVIVFRSMHAVGGEELGFLPGSEAEKMDPWTAAVYDSLGSFMESSAINALKMARIIEVLPLTHIRGRTLNGAFILIDESQNLHRTTILTALSRLGKNSKAVMSWDVSQRDNFRVGRHDGVYEVVSRLLGERLFAHTSLQKSERSDVAELVSRKLDDFEL
jgi:PhoH-like ATPase